jgi:hypothetical protein
MTCPLSGKLIVAVIQKNTSRFDVGDALPTHQFLVLLHCSRRTSCEKRSGLRRASSTIDNEYRQNIKRAAPESGAAF